MIVKNRVDTYKVSKFHDDCGGEMTRVNNVAYTSNPPKYLHACSKCGFRELLNHSYPYFSAEIQS